jgi:hypothetical protein
MSMATPESSAQRALGASCLALLVACASLTAFLPPMLEATLTSIFRMALLGCAAAVGIVLHWVFLGIAAHRLDRSAPGWVSLGLMFPIGGAAALILLGFFSEEPDRHPPPAPLRGT